jgi:hypothetical protein
MRAASRAAPARVALPRVAGRRISIHIGHQKCASTTLQAALFANLEALRRRGAVVADEQLGFPLEGPLGGPPTFYVDRMCDREEDGLHEAVARLHEAVRGLPEQVDHLIVSAESLTRPRAEFFAKALAHAYRVEVIYYVRRPQDFLVSAWAQWGCLKGLPLRAFVEHEFGLARPDYLAVAERWAAHAASCHVAPLHPSALRGGDVVQDFFAALGYPDLEVAAPPPQNVMLDWSLLEVFADCPFLFQDIHDTALGDWLKQMVKQEAERPLLAGDLVAEIAARYDESNRRLHARFFPDVDFDAALATRINDCAPTRTAEEEQQAEMARLRRAVGVQLELARRLQQDA